MPLNNKLQTLTVLGTSHFIIQIYFTKWEIRCYQLFFWQILTEKSLPSLLTAIVWLPLQITCTIIWSATAFTCTGLNSFCTEPCPSCPYLPLPQVNTYDHSAILIKSRPHEEVYKEHNAVMEMKEKQQQDFPSPVKKLTECESIVGKGASQSQTTGGT